MADFNECGELKVRATGWYGGKQVKNLPITVEVVDGLCAGTLYTKVEFVGGPHDGLTVVCDQESEMEVTVNLKTHGSDGFCINGGEAAVADAGYRADEGDEGFNSDITAPPELQGLRLRCK